MAIDFRKYVNIVSGVAAGATVRLRDLMMRLITSNPLVSPGVVLEFTNADGVATYFGTGSVEHKRAISYFRYISPSIAKAKRISFARWAETGTAASVIGNNDAKTLAQVQAIVAGGFSVSLNGAAPIVVSALNLSGAASLAAAAALIQTALRAAGGAPAAAATVTFGGSTGAQRFTVAFPGLLGTVTIASTAAGVNDVATILGLKASTMAIGITGVAAQTALEAFSGAVDVSDNFGTGVFVDELSLAEASAISDYVAEQNVRFAASFRVLADDAGTWAAALAGNAGTSLTLYSASLPDEYPEQAPATIMAATDYSKRNAVQNYMFRSFDDLTPLVSDTSVSDAYDAQRVNYYGFTQKGGQRLPFYQRGKFMGGTTAPVDQNVYANEMWLKDRAASDIMSLQLSISRIPANDSGRAMILNVLQPVIDAALFNGVISVGKTLTAIQKVFISEQTGDDLAWHAVEGVGYILSCVVEPYTLQDSSTEYKAVYSLIYAKDDAIRLVEGTHSLI